MMFYSQGEPSHSLSELLGSSEGGTPENGGSAVPLFEPPRIFFFGPVRQPLNNA